MPYLDKNTLSQFIRTDCRKQLRLNLSPNHGRFLAERTQEVMPEPQPPRPGLQAFREEGDRWQAQKLQDLTETFGQEFVTGNRNIRPDGRVVYDRIALQQAIAGLNQDSF